MSQFSTEQRRTFIALLCRIAWADGIVRDSEREVVHGLAARLANGLFEEGELDGWLDDKPPPAELETLPEGLGQLFYYEAFRLAEADGDLANEEVELLEELLNRVFTGHADGTTLARIALTKRGQD